VVALSEGDEFDEWVDSRERRVQQSRSYEYVSRDIPGCEDLDDHGRWVTLPAYGTVWTPTTVAAGWSPYYDGHWIWQDPWGWTWVGAEPWGWAPYHYGRWVFSASRWYWVPVRTSVVHVAYAPALVAFVGGGPGWSVSVGTGYVGWFPLAPGRPFYPWYGQPRTYVSSPQVTYVNRVHVTVVNRTTFVNGGFVRTNVVRDTNIVRDVSRGQVAGGALPLVPERGALRSRRAPRPPGRPEAAGDSRVLCAPRRRGRPRDASSAPLPFERKAELIRENRGKPLTATTEATVEARDRASPARAEAAVPPAASVQGRREARAAHCRRLRCGPRSPSRRVGRRPSTGSTTCPSRRAVARPRRGAPVAAHAAPQAVPPMRAPERTAHPAERPAQAPAVRPSPPGQAPPAAGPRPDTPKEKLRVEKEKARGEPRGAGPKKRARTVARTTAGARRTRRTAVGAETAERSQRSFFVIVI
jgi:hypothetical protein